MKKCILFSIIAGASSSMSVVRTMEFDTKQATQPHVLEIKKKNV